MTHPASPAPNCRECGLALRWRSGTLESSSSSHSIRKFASVVAAASVMPRQTLEQRCGAHIRVPGAFVGPTAVSIRPQGPAVGVAFPSASDGDGTTDGERAARRNSLHGSCCAASFRTEVARRSLGVSGSFQRSQYPAPSAERHAQNPPELV
jgi:hypothetical protein